MQKPKVNSESQKRLDEAVEKVDALQTSLREFNPFEGLKDADPVEPQTKISNREANRATAIEIKPVRTMRRPVGGKDGAKVYFDRQKHGEQYDKDHQIVTCIVENHEIIGEEVELWTAKWGCDPAEFWRVPVNKPVRMPRYLAEQLANCSYHRLKMEDGADKVNYVGKGPVVDQVVRRIDARPVGFGFA